MPTAKEELTQLIQQQPDDSTREQIVRELAFHIMVERGLADSDAGQVVSDETISRRLRLARECVKLDIAFEKGFAEGTVREDFTKNIPPTPLRRGRR
jgi:hypothetical protein